MKVSIGQDSRNVYHAWAYSSFDVAQESSASVMAYAYCPKCNNASSVWAQSQGKSIDNFVP